MPQDSRDEARRLRLRRMGINPDGGYVYNPCLCGCGREAMGFRDDVVPQHRARWYDQLRERAKDGDDTAFNTLYRLGLTIEKPIMTGFGFEAEFFGISDDTAVDALSNSGLPTRADGYHHDKKPYWRITDDGSVDNEGLEMVSPILAVRGPSIADGRKAVTALSRQGAVVNQSCGLHVHHSGHGLKLADFIEVVMAYTAWKPVINSIMPYSRRDSQWAHTLNTSQRALAQTQRLMTERWAEGGATSYDGLAGCFERYHAVNLQALEVHGTVEFRQHSGTLNPDKVEHWVKLTRLFMRSKRRGNNILTLLDHYDYSIPDLTAGGVEGLCDYLGTTDKTKKFYVDRAATLARFSDDDEDVGEQYRECDCGDCSECGYQDDIY